MDDVESYFLLPMGETMAYLKPSPETYSTTLSHFTEITSQH
jgi:hypothetical protein